MSSLKNWKRFLSGNSAAPFIKVSHHNTKRTLPKARSNENRISIHGVLGLCYLRDFRILSFPLQQQ